MLPDEELRGLLSPATCAKFARVRSEHAAPCTRPGSLSIHRVQPRKPALDDIERKSEAYRCSGSFRHQQSFLQKR